MGLGKTFIICNGITLETLCPEHDDNCKSTDIHWGLIVAKAIMKTLPRTAKPAAFGPTDMKAVIEVGAPSYTSGAHMWNGTAAILKPKAAAKSVMERVRAGLPTRPFSLMYDAIALISVVPVNP